MTGPDSSRIDSSRLKNHIEAMAAQTVDVSPDASSRHLHNGLDTPMPPADLHGSYTNNRPLPTGVFQASCRLKLKFMPPCSL